MDVLLIYPPYSYPRKGPPLGLAYIASVLEKDGYSVKMVDMSPLDMGLSDLGQELMRIKPHIVGISFMTNQYEEAIEVSKIVKNINSKIPVIVGGPHATALPGETLESGSVDFVVIGEGEETMRQLVSELLRGANDFELVAGIAYKKNSKLLVTERREFIQDLDSIPFPAWHLLPIERYSILASGANVKKKVLSILSSRGCPSQCIFCDSHTIFGRKYRGRSAVNIFAEILHLKDSYDISQFDFVDDTITVDKKRIMELCSLIIKRGLNIKWMCNSRVNTVNLEMLELMKRAGCVRIDLGVESGDKNVLKVIKKGITVEQIRSVHDLAHKVGIETTTFIMVGNLGEDFSSVKKTVELVKNIITDDVNVAIATPFPGTELYQIAKARGWLRVTDWSRYVTAPTYLIDYRPVMVTDKMGEDEIIRAFFYIHSKFLRKKFETRYGKRFYINTHFYSDGFFRVRGWKDIMHKGKLARSLISHMFKGE